MPILPEEIATATFTRVHRQGYHTGEVEAFLRDVAADYGAALEKMYLGGSEQTSELDIGQEVNSILRAARDSASALLTRAQEEAAALQLAAVENAQGIESQASEARVRAFEQASAEVAKVKAEADQYAEELRTRTENEARELVERAEERARHLFAYNQQLSQRIDEIERLVVALRNELDAPQRAWPQDPPPEAPVRLEETQDDQTVHHMEEDLQREGV
jgi:DivIVA domain-containing protein